MKFLHSYDSSKLSFSGLSNKNERIAQEITLLKKRMEELEKEGGEKIKPASP